MFWLERHLKNKGKETKMKPSLTISGLVVILLGFLFEQFGVEIAQAEIQSFINVGLQIIGLVMAYVGRVRAGGINVFGFKK